VYLYSCVEWRSEATQFANDETGCLGIVPAIASMQRILVVDLDIQEVHLDSTHGCGVLQLLSKVFDVQRRVEDRVLGDQIHLLGC
jgi:hypothetical protein